MTKAVLTTKMDPTYDDRPEEQYHFPRTYIRAVEAAVGDWIVYYEPRRSSGDLSSRGGRQSYFATARVTSIRPDPMRQDHFYADIRDFQVFARAVPFKDGSHYYEAALQRPDGATSKGAFGRAVRSISEKEYELILAAGFVTVLADEVSEFNPSPQGFAEEQVTFERPIIERIMRRPVREAAFSSAIRNAYHNTCAFTGLRIINGGGRPEVQAAHIKPVSELGPDSVRNGLALCSASTLDVRSWVTLTRR